VLFAAARSGGSRRLAPGQATWREAPGVRPVWRLNISMNALVVP
jgi:hypothetical protein